MSELGELSGDIEESNSEEQFIQNLSVEIQVQKKTVSENSFRYSQEIDKLSDEKRNLDIQIVNTGDDIKTVELLLKTRNQELTEQQNKYDKLLSEKRQNQEQLDEITQKLNKLLETKKTYTQDISLIKSILPQLEKEEETRKKTLENLLSKQKETEAQISTIFAETKILYSRLEGDKEGTLSEERKLIEYWFALETTFRRMEEQVEPYVDKALPQPMKAPKTN